MAYQDERKIKKCEMKNEFIKMCLLVRSINKKILYKVLANFKAYLFTYSPQVFIEVWFFFYLKDALSNLRQFLSTECPYNDEKLFEKTFCQISQELMTIRPYNLISSYNAI